MLTISIHADEHQDDIRLKGIALLVIELVLAKLLRSRVQGVSIGGHFMSQHGTIYHNMHGGTVHLRFEYADHMNASVLKIFKTLLDSVEVSSFVCENPPFALVRGHNSGNIASKHRYMRVYIYIRVCMYSIIHIYIYV